MEPVNNEKLNQENFERIVMYLRLYMPFCKMYPDEVTEEIKENIAKLKAEAEDLGIDSSEWEHDEN